MMIRAIEPSDISAVADCHARAWRAAFRGILSDGLLDGLTATEFAESWCAHIANTGRLNLVADGADGIVGFVAVAINPPHYGAEGEIMGIYVHPDHWGAGIGRELLTAGLTRMAAAGYSSAFLWTMAANNLSRTFYEAVGMSLSGESRLSERLGEKFDEVHYSCRLPFEA